MMATMACCMMGSLHATHPSVQGTPMTKILRTPAERFADLPGFAFAAHSRDDLTGYAGLAMSYLDEGPKAAPVFLCLHGQPTWSYLYRRMIPHFLATGGRAVAPDFFGFGRSDKPADEAVYTFDFHRDSLLAFIRALDLKDITLVVQDWGGLLGLTLPVAFPARIQRLLVMNTAFGIGAAPSDGFLQWRDYVAKTPDLKCGALLKRGAAHLTDAEAAAYDAPFPDPRYKAGVRRFPQLVPIAPEMDGVAVSRAAQAWWREAFRGQSFMAIGMKDPVLGPAVMRALRAHVHGCPEPLEIPDGSHFVQEWGEDIAKAALRAWGGA
jgi:haloalkane dehalogenase